MDLTKLSMKELVAEYNRIAHKHIKKFETRAIAEKRVAEMLVSSGLAGPALPPPGIPASRLVEVPVANCSYSLLALPDGVDPATATIEERVAIAARLNEVGPKLPRAINHAVEEQIAIDAERRSKASRFAIAALGRGYLVAGEQANWTEEKDEAMTFNTENAAKVFLTALIKRNQAPDYAGVIHLGDPLPSKPERKPRPHFAPRPPAEPVVSKTAKVKKMTKAPRAADPQVITLKAICAELGIDPSLARKILRADGQRAPDARWEWAVSLGANIKEVLKKGLPK